MTADATKTCTNCGEEKPLSAFHDKRRQCKECRLEQRRTYPSYTVGYIRRQNFKTRYGLTIEEIEGIYAEQNGYCAICDVEMRPVMSYTTEIEPFVVDHNALTGEVRGLLCNSCNLFIGIANEDTERLHNAIIYLAQRGTHHSYKGPRHEEAHQDAEEDR